MAGGSEPLVAHLAGPHVVERPDALVTAAVSAKARTSDPARQRHIEPSPGRKATPPRTPPHRAASAGQPCPPRRIHVAIPALSVSGAQAPRQLAPAVLNDLGFCAARSGSRRREQVRSPLPASVAVRPHAEACSLPHNAECAPDIIGVPAAECDLDEADETVASSVDIVVQLAGG